MSDDEAVLVDIEAEAEPTPPPPPMPADVRTMLTAWWLTIGLSLLAIIGLWPLVSETLPKVMSTSNPDNLVRLGNILFYFLAGTIAVIGVAVGIGIVRKSQRVRRLFKVIILGGIAAGLLAGMGLLILNLQGAAPAGSRPGINTTAKPSALGPSPILAMSILGFLGLFPIFFAGLALSLSASKEVAEYFRPPAPPHDPYASTIGYVPEHHDEHPYHQEETVSHVAEAEPPGIDYQPPPELDVDAVVAEETEHVAVDVVAEDDLADIEARLGQKPEDPDQTGLYNPTEELEIDALDPDDIEISVDDDEPRPPKNPRRPV